VNWSAVAGPLFVPTISQTINCPILAAVFTFAAAKVSETETLRRGLERKVLGEEVTTFPKQVSVAETELEKELTLQLNC